MDENQSDAGKMDATKGRAFTVADFIAAASERLRLHVVAGEGAMSHTVDEPIVNRPGLALTGFYRHFAWRRMQLVGNAEFAYLSSLSREERAGRFRELLEHKANFIVFTGVHGPHRDMKALASEFGAGVLSTPLKTRVFARLATFEMERLAAPETTIYGTMVEVCGLGVLIEGNPGLGKSETALGLIKRGSAALVADDLTTIRRDMSSDRLYGRAGEATEGFMEIRGIGIIHVPEVFGIYALSGERRLQLVITLKRYRDVGGEIDRIGNKRERRDILGIDVPNMILPVSEGRDLVNLVETAAQQEKLLCAGYNAAESLSARLRGRAAKNMAARQERNANGR